MTLNDQFQDTWDYVIVAYFKELVYNSSGGTEEKHQIAQSE
jgi:hypothetical protein